MFIREVQFYEIQNEIIPEDILRVPASKLRGNSDYAYDNNYEGFKQRVRDIIEQQNESIWSNLFFFSQIVFIIVSITSFVVATLPKYKDPFGSPVPQSNSPAYPFFIIEGPC